QAGMEEVLFSQTKELWDLKIGYAHAVVERRRLESQGMLLNLYARRKIEVGGKDRPPVAQRAAHGQESVSPSDFGSAGISRLRVGSGAEQAAASGDLEV